MNRIESFFIPFLLITLSATPIRIDLSSPTGRRFIVWNVGQGQWVTLVRDKTCDHFDMGGEFDVSFKVLMTCQGRTHRVHLSHWDWDHVGFLRHFRQLEKKLCLWGLPLGQTSPRKRLIVDEIPLCTDIKSEAYQVIFKGDPSQKATSNDSSEVVLSRRVLIPGDSTSKEEKKWAHHRSLIPVWGLILGHHGSGSSSSDQLLQHLPQLKWAVATARKSRYGHPHASVIKRLRKKQVPLLLTEDWGNIIISE